MPLSLRHILKIYLGEFTPIVRQKSNSFVPSNIALCKYWGKRDAKLNLPINNSISISLGNLGTSTHITVINSNNDIITLNGHIISYDSDFFKRSIQFCDLFRQFGNVKFLIETYNNIPTKAGLASSASGFAALTLALFRLYSIPEKSEKLSRVARLGSGSACRSFYRGFSEWICGTDESGIDSFAVPLKHDWLDLRIGLLNIIEKEKKVGSSDAMNLTGQTSPFFSQWIKQSYKDLFNLKQSIINRDFIKFGEISENNALKMHATMLSSYPTLLYWEEQTITNMKRVWQAREEGVPVYFTLDAGPNLKLLFTNDTSECINKLFPEIKIINPYDDIPIFK
ncbi:diphosphomevalonate decarboxylase [Candidatus Liberibacter americanus]|uniref:diphosphomevalonate decarboxylase n=1 Tax=Candidatus Liberibacter americanus str. Sao Paulo TaxID=1261131 RepID=U6B5K8_9HYPH|nr:diphosphomevalonate decarboxylase [Candidatus Liberibacter americanus]AHA28073.1 Mevalonate pyrophosphate decarboxylase [Candidatus Liberibacter americanus str. Sao Paulo]EMS35958.1 diphosphomevalonate decarboxylase/isopentenyl-diphosphate delta-isomerase [Candidatus Liberibacter americanus PW_SP]